MIIEADNFNDLFDRSFDMIEKYGRVVSPRSKQSKELLTPQLVLTDPKNCIITKKARKLNYAYLIIEKMQYFSQVSFPDITIAYNKRMGDFINENINDFDGAYGPRIKSNNQLMWCVEKLKEDKDTRQAVVTIHDSSDKKKTKDCACTTNWQFVIRDGGLIMVANMRSNDLLWGTCLDIPAFCFIGEAVANWVGVPFVKYIHQPVSLHYYDDVKEQLIATRECKDYNEESHEDFDISLLDYNKMVNRFWREELAARKLFKEETTESKVLDSFIKRLRKYWMNKYEKLA